MSLPLRILLILNFVATLAAAIVLVVAPNLIPTLAGAPLPPGAWLFPRLHGAYELGLAVLCGMILLHPQKETVRLGVWVLLGTHAASAGAEALSLPDGVNALVLGNLVLRLVLVALLWWFGLRRQTTA